MGVSECRSPEPSGATEVKPVNLALQGGGAHGAFSWGVLDTLLDDGRITIEAISGTSAGAMNAVVTAQGLMEDGNEGARKALDRFWKSVSEAGSFSPFQRTLWDVMTGNWNLDHSPGYLMFDLISRVASPYQLNPFNLNPLRDMLDRLVDFDLVRSCDKMKLFISATNVSNGRVKVFKRSELTADMVMASASLPYMFRPVEIEGESYWDGGYMGNPVLYPFAYNCTAPDVVIVQINPMKCREIPKAARDILNRTSEITFNASLIHELRAIEFAGRLIDQGRLNSDRYKKMLIHIIEAESDFQELNASSKLNSEWAFFTFLRDIGRKTAKKWLDSNISSISRKSTVNLRELLRGKNC